MWYVGRLAAITAILLPNLASATVYEFHSTETSALSSSPTSFDFALDTTLASVAGGATSFSNITISKNGVPAPGNTVQASFTTDIASPLFFLVDTSLVPFYSGTGVNIAFNPGTFAIADGLTDGEGTLAISSPSVPEPPAWALVSSGIALLGVALGRRRRADA